ncbi:sensor histidine kinase [Janibacter sp. GXQ6167]|uniref:sensor histidine kinase n=1 Tax=Janibacter sp. GXQ6167 TaxID=3240791 RepID=UPI003523F614
MAEREGSVNALGHARLHAMTRDGAAGIAATIRALQLGQHTLFVVQQPPPPPPPHARLHAMTRDGAAGIAATIRALQLGQHTLFVVLALVCSARSISAGTPWWAQILGIAALGAWYVYGIVLARGARRPPPPPSANARAFAQENARAFAKEGAGRGVIAARWWLLGLTLGWIGLVVLSAENVWLAFPLWLLAGHLLPLGLAVGLSLLILAVVVVAPMQAGRTNFAAIIGPLVGSIVALGVARAQDRLVRDSIERQELISRLVAAQEETAALSDDLARSEREAGVLAERSRLSRDIHDTLAQGFSSILLLVRTGADEEDPERRARLLRQIESTAAEGLEESRRVVGALAPSQLDDDSLVAALRRLVDRLADETGIEADVVVGGPLPALPTSTEVALLRTAQGALANVRLHSGARRVRVSIDDVSDPEGGRSVRLDIVDDGRGFDAHTWRESAARRSPLRGGYGLAATAARLREIGGTFEVESAPGDGTALSADVPLTTPARAGEENS